MEDQTVINLGVLLDIIKKKIWIIGTITLIATLVTALVSVFLISPTYESKVSVLIGKQNAEKVTNQDVALYQMTYQTFKDIAGTNDVAKLAAEKLGDGTDFTGLLSRTSISAKSGTMIITISVQDNSPEKAYKEVQAYSEAFLEKAKSLNLQSGGIEVVDSAQVPKSPIAPHVKRNVASALFFSFFLSVAVIFIHEYIKRK